MFSIFTMFGKELITFQNYALVDDEWIEIQELIEMGDTQKANQVINRVKYYFSEYTNTRDCINAERNVD
jgi:hypothetical protein